MVIALRGVEGRPESDGSGGCADGVVGDGAGACGRGDGRLNQCGWRGPPSAADPLAGDGSEALVPPADGEMDGGAESSRFGVLSYGPPPLVLSGTAPGIDTEDRTPLAPTSSAARGNRRPTGGPRAVLAVPAATSAVSAAAGSGGLTVSSAANATAASDIGGAVVSGSGPDSESSPDPDPARQWQRSLHPPSAGHRPPRQEKTAHHLPGQTPHRRHLLWSDCGSTHRIRCDRFPVSGPWCGRTCR